MNPDCQCELAGYCERHKVLKASRHVELCQQRGEYWQAWEECRGPGQGSNLAREPEPTCQYNHWATLHYYPVKHRHNWNPFAVALWYWGVWVAALPRGCGCSVKWVKLEIQPDFSSAEAFFEWTHVVHNIVNVELGKAFRPTLEESYAIWFTS